MTHYIHSYNLGFIFISSIIIFSRLAYLLTKVLKQPLLVLLTPGNISVWITMQGRVVTLSHTQAYFAKAKLSELSYCVLFSSNTLKMKFSKFVGGFWKNIYSVVLSPVAGLFNVIPFSQL